LIAYHSIIPSSFIVDDEDCMFWWGVAIGDFIGENQHKIKKMKSNSSQECVSGIERSSARGVQNSRFPQI